MMLKPALRPPLRAPMRGATTLREGGGEPQALPAGYAYVTSNGVYVISGGAFVITRVS